VSIREGDLVVMSNGTDVEDRDTTGIVLKIRKREVATPHPNYRGKHPPIEVKVIETVEVLWGHGQIDSHDARSLERVKKNEKRQPNNS